MLLLARTLQYLAKWCNAISYSWRTRDHMTYGYKHGKSWQARKGFWRGIKSAHNSIYWEEV